MNLKRAYFGYTMINNPTMLQSTTNLYTLSVYIILINTLPTYCNVLRIRIPLIPSNDIT